MIVTTSVDCCVFLLLYAVGNNLYRSAAASCHTMRTSVWRRQNNQTLSLCLSWFLVSFHDRISSSFILPPSRLRTSLRPPPARPNLPHLTPNVSPPSLHTRRFRQLSPFCPIYHVIFTNRMFMNPWTRFGTSTTKMRSFLS